MGTGGVRAAGGGSGLVQVAGDRVEQPGTEGNGWAPRGAGMGTAGPVWGLGGPGTGREEVGLCLSQQQGWVCWRVPHPALLLPSAPWHHIENLDLFFSRISFHKARFRRGMHPAASWAPCAGGNTGFGVTQSWGSVCPFPENTTGLQRGWGMAEPPCLWGAVTQH